MESKRENTPAPGTEALQKCGAFCIFNHVHLCYQK